MSSKKTPKPRPSGLRALEEVSTSVRRKGAPRSFVFVDESENENSSDSRSSALSSDSEDEGKKKGGGRASASRRKAPRPPRTKRGRPQPLLHKTKNRKMLRIRTAIRWTCMPCCFN